jgi:hypothetical protein
VHHHECVDPRGVGSLARLLLVTQALGLQAGQDRCSTSLRRLPRTAGCAAAVRVANRMIGANKSLCRTGMSGRLRRAHRRLTSALSPQPAPDLPAQIVNEHGGVLAGGKRQQFQILRQAQAEPQFLELQIDPPAVGGLD